MSIKSLMDRIKKHPDLDKKAFQILLGLLSFYILYYLVMFFLPPLLHLDLNPYLYRIGFSYVIIVAIGIVSIALPFATKYSNRKKRYVIFSFIILFLLLPILVVFESFLRVDWSFGR